MFGLDAMFQPDVPVLELVVRTVLVLRAAKALCVSLAEAEEAVRQASLPDVGPAARVMLEPDVRISVIPGAGASAA
jgi:hypothetical protein